MSEIHELVSLLSPGEQREFTKYLSNRNKRHDTRNTDLFKALTKGGENKIKDKIGSNAYNVLKKRLSDRLLDFIGSNTLNNEVSEEAGIIKQILLGRKLFAYNKIKVAFKIIHKAEERAIEIGHYALLSEIYHTLVEHSHRDLSQSQEVLFQKLKDNNQAFLEQEKLNMVYAIVRKAYQDAEYNSEPVHLEGLLMSNYAKFNIKDRVGYSFQSLYQLALIADISGAHYNNYHDVALFFEYRIRKMKGGPSDVEKTLIYHIDLLYSVSNIYFRKKEFDKSLKYLDDMYIQMNRYNKKYYKVSYPKYITLRALNLNFKGLHANGYNELSALFNIKEYSTEDLLNAKLAAAMIHFQQDRIKAAHQIVAKFMRTDSWYERHIGINWVLNKNFIEILLHIELGNMDLADSRIKSFSRKYRQLFKEEEHSQELNFLKLVRVYHEDPGVVQSKEFSDLVKSTVRFKTSQEEDLFFMSYFAWLKSKMKDRPLYEVTLAMIQLDHSTQ